MVLNSGQASTHRRTPIKFRQNAGEAALIGEHKLDVCRTPAKPPFTGAAGVLPDPTESFR